VPTLTDTTRTPPHDQWAGVVDKDETIIWQGQPDSGFILSFRMILGAAFGTVFAGSALYWMIVSAQAGSKVWMIGLIHMAVGIALAAGSLLKPAYGRRRTSYMLTDKRAYIATNLPLIGRSLKSYPITKDTVIDYQDATLPSIIFAKNSLRAKNGMKIDMPIGFERIRDGHAVLGHLRQIQDGSA
jgi:hypothetical protein